MACTIERPTPQALFNRLRDMFSTTVLGGAPIIPESNEWYVTSLNYAVAEEFYSFAEQQWRERDPRYACCDNLIELARADGVYLRAATFAQGYVRITGTPGAGIPDGVIQFTSNGVTFELSGSIPQVMPATGRVTALFRSTVAGPDGNTTAGATGTLVGVIPGINQTVTILGSGFCGGQAEETCEEFRQRYIARKQYQPRATDAWVQQKLLEWPCVTRVCRRGGNCCDPTDECSCSDCQNKIEYYVFFDNTFECGLAPECVIDDITIWMFGEPQGYGNGQMEVGICGQIYTATPALIDIVIDGVVCITPSQQTEITDQLRDFFKTICPSEMLYTRQLETIIANVLGTSVGFDIMLSSDSTQVEVTPCGIDPECDIMPCFGSVTFPSAQDVIGACAE